MSRLKAIEEEAERYGINKRHTNDPHRRVEWIVRCRCGADDVNHWAPSVPPDAMVKAMKLKRWEMGRGDAPQCPACLKAKTAKARALDAPKPRVLTPVPWLMDAVTMKDKQQASDCIAQMITPIEEVMVKDEELPRVAAAALAKPSPNKIIARKVYGLLEDNLDETVRAYRNGYSDQRIADEVGCHLSVVLEIRTESFCELIEDTRISALREDVSKFERAFERVVKTAADDIAALRSRLEQIAMSTKSR